MALLRRLSDGCSEILPKQLDDRVCLYLIAFSIEYLSIQILIALPKIAEVCR